MTTQEDVNQTALKLINLSLENYLLKYCSSSRIEETLRYALFPGGKRLRPLIAIRVCGALGGDQRNAVAPACALELIHSYSLIHDDLPCMDDADTRRGKPSCHKKFGEAMAVLAGDALLTLAFEIIAKESRDATMMRQCQAEIAEAAGARSLIHGQIMDLYPEEKSVAYAIDMYTWKTAALFGASFAVGAIAAKANHATVRSMRKCGYAFGMMFQTADDLADKDANKLTIPGIAGRDGALRILRRSQTILAKFLKKRPDVLDAVMPFVMQVIGGI